MTNPLKYLRLVYVSLRVIKDPHLLDEVLKIAGTINDKKEMGAIIEHLKTMPKQAAALESRPALGTIDAKALAQLPEGTLGHAFADFLNRKGFKVGDIQVQNQSEMSGTVEEYVAKYFYDTHDLFHVVTGFDTDVAGEMGLQAFYCSKGPGNLTVFLMTLLLMNTFLFAQDDKDARLSALAKGWKMGRESVNFFGIDWKAMWDRPLAEVRQELGVPAAA